MAPVCSITSLPRRLDSFVESPKTKRRLPKAIHISLLISIERNQLHLPGCLIGDHWESVAQRVRQGRTRIGLRYEPPTIPFHLMGFFSLSPSHSGLGAQPESEKEPSKYMSFRR